MASFTDDKSNVWQVVPTLADFKRVKAVLGIDLLNIANPRQAGGDVPLCVELDMDIPLMCDVVYVLVQPQAEKLVVSSEAFGGSLGGDATAAMRTAFWGALADFFRRLGQPSKALAIEKQTEVAAAAGRWAESKIAGLDAEALVRQTTGKYSTDSPATSVLSLTG